MHEALFPPQHHLAHAVLSLSAFCMHMHGEEELQVWWQNYQLAQVVMILSFTKHPTNGPRAWSHTRLPVLAQCHLG
jgi:hypothetical protein